MLGHIRRTEENLCGGKEKMDFAKATLHKSLQTSFKTLTVLVQNNTAPYCKLGNEHMSHTHGVYHINMNNLSVNKAL